MNESALTQPVLALVRDLLFASRISSTGQALGTNVNLIRDPAKLSDQPGRLLLVDLNLDGAISAAARWKAAAQGTVVGFVSHVDTQTIEQARAAGLDRIMARGQFVQMLPEMLKAGSTA